MREKRDGGEVEIGGERGRWERYNEGGGGRAREREREGGGGGGRQDTDGSAITQKFKR